MPSAAAGTVKKGYADTRIGQLYYIEAGRGPVLVLIPHAGRSVRMFEDLVATLADRYRVLAFDVPGTGASAMPPAGEVSVHDLADWLVDAFDSLGLDRFALFGLHGGNKIGASIAVRHPHRVSAFVYAGQSHSIVVSNRRRAEIFAATPCINTIVSADEALADSPLLWSRQFRDLTDLWWSDAALARLTLEQRQRVVGRVVDSLQAFLWRPLFYRATRTYDMEADLRRLEVPTLVLELATPAEDRLCGRQGPDLLRAIHHARLATLEFADTFVVTLEDRVDEVAGIIAHFLQDVTPG